MTDKHALIQPDRGQQATPIHLVDKTSYEDWLKGRSTGREPSASCTCS